MNDYTKNKNYYTLNYKTLVGTYIVWKNSILRYTLYQEKMST